ncbi:MAG: transcription elongation factor GreB [Gammaproteobacteria bacterium]|nr:transcription elongation factor GreB [Gammaproteobacteria bacterium]MDH5275096.1 transcription elongation factor GreB [Gammaproteobacteria bacterium]
MSKAFTREADGDAADDAADFEAANPLPSGAKNYITAGGKQRLADELQYLLNKDRPAVTAVVSWAARNGDRSENADYQYGKRRLREIDRRIRFLTRRLDSAELVEIPTAPDDPRAGRVFFGATVTYADEKGTRNTVTIVGVDEIDLKRNHISWVSPLARALMKSGPGDSVVVRVPDGSEELEIIDVRYVPIETLPFEPVTAAFKPAPSGG